jgi:transcriptional regulator with XRE-family HTH domain
MGGVNTFRDNTRGKRPQRKRPIYASHIRELRRAVGLSQRSLARELNLKRGAVAQWEGGVREPLPRNYKALAEFAKGRGLAWLEDFFGSQGVINRKQKSLKAEQKWQASYAERYLAGEKALAAMGNQEAKRLIGLSQMGRAAYRRYLLTSIYKEVSELKTWHFSDVLSKFCDEAGNVERLRMARESLVKKFNFGADADGPK